MARATTPLLHDTFAGKRDPRFAPLERPKVRCSEAVSQSVIPVKPREAGREAGSRSLWNCDVFLDSGSHDA
jgi:hypothetical protein